MKEITNENQVLEVLNSLHEKAINGIPKVSKPVDIFANEYLEKNETVEKATKELIKFQIAKCGTSGFLTGLGGVITLPVAIPANISSIMYIQLRMILAIAYIGGFDIKSDQVQTLAYVCLTGSVATEILKKSGIKLGEKFLETAIKRIPGESLKIINQKVGFRLLTKFGTKGIINLGKAIPIAGGVIGGIVDITSTKIIAMNAYNMFIKKEIPSNEVDNNSDEVIDKELYTILK